MKKSFKNHANRLVMALATATIFSCSSGDDSLPQFEYLYCVYPEEQICELGPVTKCSRGGIPKDVCPDDFSKIKAPSSSSRNNVSDIPRSSSSQQNILERQSSSSIIVKGSLYDLRDGNSYQTVKIGNQTWMAENLNYAVAGSKCGDGSSLSDANTTACNLYGRLYSWSTAIDGCCPIGWHLPSDAEWTDLENYAGGSSIAGKELKAASGWEYCNPSGTNVSYDYYLCNDTYGFSALPGGRGDSYSLAYGIGGERYGYWWTASSDEEDNYTAVLRNMDYNYNGVYRWDRDRSNLYSVRCVKD
jgi:uncharacterized protein (TIGR02145 family)